MTIRPIRTRKNQTKTSGWPVSVGEREEVQRECERVEGWKGSWGGGVYFASLP